MTREDLLQKVSAAIDETLYAYSHGEMSDDMAKESILALIPPQPKLEWREHDEWGAAYFHIGDLRIGEIRKDGGVWHAWAGGFRHGFYEDRDVAKRAVEEAVRKALR